MQMDPSRQEINPYLYASANPLNYVDPSGLSYGIPLPPICQTEPDLFQCKVMLSLSMPLPGPAAALTAPAEAGLQILGAAVSTAVLAIAAKLTADALNAPPCQEFSLDLNLNNNFLPGPRIFEDTQLLIFIFELMQQEHQFEYIPLDSGIELPSTWIFSLEQQEPYRESFPYLEPRTPQDNIFLSSNSRERGLWQLTSEKSDKIATHPTFGVFYRDPSTDFWWVRDLAGHGGSAFKVFEETPRGLQWLKDANQYGDYIEGKHKGSTGLFIPWRELRIRSGR